MSLYVDTETKKRLESAKPTQLPMVGFLNAMVTIWEQSTPEQQIKAINATKEENK